MCPDGLSAPFAHVDSSIHAETKSAEPHFNADQRVSRIIKRLMDLVLTFAALPIIVPFLAIVSVFMFARTGGPVFFVHRRVGKDGHEFGCIKFRTMVRDADATLQEYLKKNPEAEEEWKRTQKLRNDPRILPGVGKFLRKSSLDELPQFFNVLMGQMSLVGPRPVTPEEMDRYGKDARIYTAVRPGITGKWQVSGRTEICYEERIKLDVEYIQNWSMLGDFKVLAKTVLVVLRRKGAI